MIPGINIRINKLLIILWIGCAPCIGFAFGQEDPGPLNDDPFLDPQAVAENLKPLQRFESPQGFMLGVSYGLNPIVVWAPPLSLAYYFEPIVVGVELSDSEKFGMWSKQRVDGLGPSRFTGNTVFLKAFLGHSFYVMGAYEKRTIDFWDRSYDRPEWGGKARFDMFFQTSVASAGIGYMRFGGNRFMAMDILRYSVVVSRSVEVVEHWETWTFMGLRDELDGNIRDRTEDWYDTLDSPSAIVFTIGYFF